MSLKFDMAWFRGSNNIKYIVNSEKLGANYKNLSHNTH